MPRPTGSFEDRDSVVVRGLTYATRQVMDKFLQTFFLANLSLPGVKD